MAFEFAYPWLLLALPIALGAVLLIRPALPARTRGGRTALGMRFALTALLSLALTAPSVVVTSRQGATWVLLDGSDSAQAARSGVEPLLRDALERAPEDLATGIIGFGANASVEAPLSAAHRYQSVSTAVDASASKLSSALELAAALLPSDAAGRIAVISDGLVDDYGAQAELLASRGVPVDVLTVESEVLPDAQVSALTLPRMLREGQSMQINVTLDANFETTGTLVLYANREPVATREVTLHSGTNQFVFQHTVRESGVVTYEALLNAEGDRRSTNNRRAAYVRVEGVARVLLVEGEAGGARELHKMLSAAGFDCDVANTARLPDSVEGLRAYEAVALVNVDADDLSPAQTRALDGAVRALGRGLAVFGGDASYALGGYRGSALEQMLPVTMDVRNTLDLPSLALVLVIDKSGSMTDGRYGTTRLELAKEAAMRAVEVLTERDHVGVIAFDDTAKWASPLALCGDVSAVQRQIGTIRPGGGTAFFAPLNEAYGALLAADAPQKHIIFLTDGEPADGGFESLVQSMAGEGITLTTVAVGSGANVPLLTRLAAAGGGRVYAAGEFDDLPKIFTKETHLAAGAYVQNRRFTPAVAERSSLTGYDGFPALDGYLATTVKPLATAALVSDRDDPVLAHWRYGAGTVLCWTSDAQGAWTGSFLRWDRAAEFFSGLISFVLPTSEQAGTLEAEVKSGVLRVRYEQPPDAAEQGLATSLRALMPDGTETALALTEVAPGAFEGELAAPGQGAYALTVTQQASDGETVRLLEGGATVPYSSEYDLRALSGESTLEALAAQTGGRVLSGADELFTARGNPARARTDLTPWLLAAAMLVFLLDVTMRRLNWPRSNARERQAREKRKKIRRTPRPDRSEPDTDPAKPSATASQLLDARRNRKIL